ncbi:hypothetical protein KAS14_02845 [Candidatus Bathyarchaeota archaeon]|nr:hypothetical protein [Candidatus Bathyarchaeota archaeon]
MKCPRCGKPDPFLDSSSYYTCQVCGYLSNIGEEWSTSLIDIETDIKPEISDTFWNTTEVLVKS